ncbi:MAG: ExeA family protein [Gammaproteobacteria bacterium]
MYTSYFGFKQMPFDSRVLLPHEFFYGESARENERALSAAILDRCAAMFLCGEAGVGKTALLRQLAYDLRQSHRFFFPKRDGDRLEPIMDCVLEAFGSNPHGKSLPRKLEILSRMRSDSRYTSGNRVLVIDDAHELTSDGIAELLESVWSEASQAPLFQLVFAGLPALKLSMDRDALPNYALDEASWYRLESLTEVESRQFIEQRLELAAYRGEPLFSDRAIKLIFDFSNGNPREISLLCGFSLMAACQEHLKIVTDDIVEEESCHCFSNQSKSGVDASGRASIEDSTQPEPDDVWMQPGRQNVAGRSRKAAIDRKRG